ncbi:hypothetical protein BGZ88_001621 [Linnemannia elongata]|nr:hypothetical protein BGZ88_001621 [Linnemannia elongata]
MSYPGTPSGTGGSGSGFPAGVYPQPIGTLSGASRPSGLPGNANTSSITQSAAGMSIQGSSTSQFAGSTSSTLPQFQQSTMPITTTPVGTAPRKQLAAAAAAGAAMGAAKSGRPKGPYKKAGGAGGGGSGPSKRGGRGGGRGGRAGSSFGPDDDDDKGGKDSDDDNEDEPEVSIEEQFILRLPPGEMLDRFREKVIAREIDESVKLNFTDARRGTFTFEGIDFPTKLVDLPTIIEAQKTLNGKQMYKIADISQMLVVDETPAEKAIKTEPGAGSRDPASQAMPAPTLPPLKPSEYIWPDGLTNPLKNVRKRRFRKRVSKVAVEGVEAEIERLLQEDAQAEEVVYEIREQVDGMDRFDSDDGATPAPEGAQSDLDMDDNDGEMMDMDEEEEEDEDEEDDEYEKDLLAELEREIGGGENATDEEGGTPQPQERKPVSQPSGLSGSHTSHSAPPQNSVHKTGAPGAGNIGGAGALSGLGEIRSASGSHTSTTGLSSGKFAGSTGVSSGTANRSEKGKAKSQDQDDDDDDDDDDEEEEEEEEEEDDDDDEDSGSDEDDEDDDEDDKEKAQVEKMLKDEIKELASKVQENEEKFQSAPNEILKKRFNLIVEQLRKELELKKSQLEEARGKPKGK